MASSARNCLASRYFLVYDDAVGLDRYDSIPLESTRTALSEANLFEKASNAVDSLCDQVFTVFGSQIQQMTQLATAARGDRPFEQFGQSHEGEIQRPSFRFVRPRPNSAARRRRCTSPCARSTS